MQFLSTDNLNLIIILSFIFIFTVSSVGAQSPNLPELELEVTEVSGDVRYLPTESDEWKSLEKGNILNIGDQVRTGIDGSAKVTAPGISVTKIDPESKLIVKNVNRDTKTQGFLFTEEEVVVNDLDMEAVKGKISNSLRDHEKVQTNYEMETPHAVAGVRGTSYSCDISEDQTECAVGEGNVFFASQKNPDRRVNIGAGQKSSVQKGDTAPSKPESVSDEQKRELEEFSNEAQKDLQIPPTISSLSLNDNSLQEGVKISYTSQTELTLSGQVQPGEETLSVTSIKVNQGDQTQQYKNSQEFSYSWTPTVPPEGDEVDQTITVKATDSNNNQATLNITITLFNGTDETTRSNQGVPPEDYESGDVSVTINSVGDKARGDMEFPYKAYRGDASGEGLEIQGTASGNATIEGVAYSLDGGSSWQLANGGSSWFFYIPSGQPGEHDIQVQAWTIDGVIGDPVELGTINYSNQQYSDALRQGFVDFWDAFERENTSTMETLLDPGFQVSLRTEDHSGGGGNETEEEFDRNDFVKYLDEELNDQTNVRIDYTFSQVLGNPNGGELEVNRLEWRGFEDSFNNESEQWPFVQLTESAKFKFNRRPNGTFKLLSFADMNFTFFLGDEFELEDRVGYEPIHFVVDNRQISGIQENTPHEGLVVAGFDDTADSVSGCSMGPGCWPGNPPKIYVNDGKTNTTQDPLSGDFCALTPCDFLVQKGGVTKLAQSGFSSVTSIPSIGSGAYKSKETMVKGGLYAFNVQTTNGRQFTWLFKVQDLSDENGDSVYDEADIRALAVERPVTEFNGVNPFR